MSKSSEKWLTEYESIERLVQTISKNLNERSKFPSSSSNYRKLSVSCRTLIGKLNTNIISLSKGLDDISQQGLLTQMEINRRTTLINQLKTNEKQFDQLLRDEKSAQKDQLFSSLSSNDVLTSNINETDETMSYSTDQLLVHQDRILAEQDRGLDTLAHVIRNQKQIASTIGTEVDRQNVLIDSMGDKVDRLQDRIVDETKRIRFIDKKSTTCGIWFVIFILFLAIIIIVAIPKM